MVLDRQSLECLFQRRILLVDDDWTGSLLIMLEIRLNFWLVLNDSQGAHLMEISLLDLRRAIESITLIWTLFRFKMALLADLTS